MKKINITPFFLAVFTLCFSVVVAYSSVFSIPVFAKSSLFSNDVVSDAVDTISKYNDKIMDFGINYVPGLKTVSNIYNDITGNKLSDSLITYDSNQRKFVQRKYNTENNPTYHASTGKFDSANNSYDYQYNYSTTVNNNTSVDRSVVTTYHNTYNDNRITVYDPTTNTYNTYNNAYYDSHDTYTTFVYENSSNYYITNVYDYGVSISFTPKNPDSTTTLWKSYCIYYILPNSSTTTEFFTKEQLSNVVWSGTVYNSNIEFPDNVVGYFSFDGSKSNSFRKSVDGNQYELIFDYNSMNYSDGYFGSAIQLNGSNVATIKCQKTDSNGTVSIVPLSDLATTQYTLEGWVYVANPVKGGTVANGWHHYAKTHDSDGSIRIFIDGIEGHVGTMSSPRFDSTSTVSKITSIHSPNPIPSVIPSGGSSWSRVDAYVSYVDSSDSLSVTYEPSFLFNYITYSDYLCKDYQYPNPVPIINQSWGSISKTLRVSYSKYPTGATYSSGSHTYYLYNCDSVGSDIIESVESFPSIQYLNTVEDVEHYYPLLTNDNILFGFTNSNKYDNLSNSDRVKHGSLVAESDQYQFEYDTSITELNNVSVRDSDYCDLSNYLLDEVIITKGLKYTTTFIPSGSPLSNHKIVPSVNDCKIGDLCISNEFGWFADTVLVGGSIPFTGVNNTVYIPLDKTGCGTDAAIYQDGWKSTRVLVFDGVSWVDASSYNFLNLTFVTPDSSSSSSNNVTNITYNIDGTRISTEYDIDIDEISNTIYNSYETSKDFVDDVPDLFSSIASIISGLGVFPTVIISLLGVFFAIILVVCAIKVVKIILI